MTARGTAAGHALARAEREIAESPDVWFVLVDGGGADLAAQGLMMPLYAVQLPQDVDRFRLRDGEEGLDVMFKFRGRWRRCVAAWRQLKGLGLDPAEGRPCAIGSFGRKALRAAGAKRNGREGRKGK